MSGCDPGCPPAQPGPAGPRGPTGPMGPAGPTGPAGPGGSLTIESDGIVVGETSVLNFIGFTVTQDGDGTINVSGGGTGDSCWECSAPDDVVRLADATDNVALGADVMSGTEKLRIVGDERLEGVFIQSIGGAAVSGVGSHRVFHGWSLQSRNSLNTLNRNILSFGIADPNEIELGDGDTVVRINGSISQIYASDALMMQITGSSVADWRPTAEVDFEHRHAGQPIFGFDAAAGVRNLAIFSDPSVSFQSGNRIMFITNRTTAPTGNPTGGGYLYAGAGAGIWRGSGGTITTFGPA